VVIGLEKIPAEDRADLYRNGARVTMIPQARRIANWARRSSNGFARTSKTETRPGKFKLGLKRSEAHRAGWWEFQIAPAKKRSPPIRYGADRDHPDFQLLRSLGISLIPNNKPTMDALSHESNVTRECSWLECHGGNHTRRKFIENGR